jgi:diamine N-acetyltransferase
MKVYLRPLQEADAEKSWKWRNDPSIWKFTGNRPSKYITAETELNWMRDALNRSDEIRFAICAGYFKEYVGNVQLTSITSDDAEFHIFIGEKLFRNQGVGSKATQLVTEYAKKKFTNQKYLFARSSGKYCGYKSIHKMRICFLSFKK